MIHWVLGQDLVALGVVAFALVACLATWIWCEVDAKWQKIERWWAEVQVSFRLGKCCSHLLILDWHEIYFSDRYRSWTKILHQFDVVMKNIYPTTIYRLPGHFWSPSPSPASAMVSFGMPKFSSTRCVFLAIWPLSQRLVVAQLECKVAWLFSVQNSLVGWDGSGTVIP